MDGEGQQRDGHPAPSWGLREVMRASRQLNIELARRVGLNATDFAALDLIMSASVSGPAELAEQLGISTASITVLVDRLDAAGHVHRGRDGADRRRVVLEPTAHAVEQTRRVLRPVLDALDEVADALAPSERSVVVAYLARVAAVMRSHAGASPPDR